MFQLFCITVYVVKCYNKNAHRDVRSCFNIFIHYKEYISILNVNNYHKYTFKILKLISNPQNQNIYRLYM